MTPQPYSKENSVQKMPTDTKSSSSDANLKSIKEGSENLIEHVKDDARNIAQGIVSEGNDKLQDAKAFAGGYMKKVENEVTAKPVQSIAIAFAAGYVANLLLGRR